jgi:hypothetical protein
MRTFRISLVAAAVAALVAAAAASALPSTSIPFTAKYSGQASTKVDGSVATISANGTGKGTLIGAGKLTGNGTGDSSQQPCVPFGGLGKMTGTAGTTISFKVLTTAQGCGDEGGHVFTLKGYATVLKATGKLAKAKGTLKFTGLYDRDGGTFNVKFTGTLKK